MKYRAQLLTHWLPSPSQLTNRSVYPEFKSRDKFFSYGLCHCILSLLHIIELCGFIRRSIKILCGFTLRFFFFFKDYLLIFRERGRERKKGRETMCGCLSCSSNWGPGLQPRHVPWLGIEPATLWFTGRWTSGYSSTHWAIPARATTLRFVIISIFFGPGPLS